VIPNEQTTDNLSEQELKLWQNALITRQCSASFFAETTEDHRFYGNHQESKTAAKDNIKRPLETYRN